MPEIRLFDCLRWVPETYLLSSDPRSEKLKLIRAISERVGRALEDQCLLVRVLKNSFLTADSPDGAGFDDLLGHSVTYRIALGPRQGRKAFALQTLPAVAAVEDNNSVAKAAGFSLHTGMTSEAHEREKLERLCRYITPGSLD
ncbi:MAG: transposase [Gammaproteobacteria bacterium]|nr:transposase [Gammaproteobacteria bacterium]